MLYNLKTNTITYVQPLLKVRHISRAHRGLGLIQPYIHNDVYTFPLWNLVGQMVGYQQYRPNADKLRKENPKDMRYYTYLPKGTNTAWGLELLDVRKPYLLVVEGIFDAVKLHNIGVNALAVLANNPVPLRSWIHSLGYIVIPVCEGDLAGQKLAGMANTNKVEYLTTGDVGDMTHEQVLGRFKCYA